CLW
ncbi:hypothetical protein D027_3028B, partial [Vibrio parahaemolyticus 861]